MKEFDGVDSNNDNRLVATLAFAVVVTVAAVADTLLSTAPLLFAAAGTAAYLRLVGEVSSWCRRYWGLLATGVLVGATIVAALEGQRLVAWTTGVAGLLLFWWQAGQATIYWRHYGSVGFVTLFGLLFFGFSVWELIVADATTGGTANRDENFYAAFARVVGGVIGVAIALQISDRIRNSRATNPGLRIESVEDDTSMPWRRVNHSFFQIGWSPNLAPEHDELLRRLFYPSHNFFWLQLSRYQLRLGFVVFEQLLEETGTLNFRLLCAYRSARFIRVHREIDIKTQELRQSVREQLVASNLFPHTRQFIEPLAKPRMKPVELADEYIRPLQLLALQPISQTAAGVPDGLLEITKVYDCDTHFAGRGLAELRSVASQIAGVQRALARWNPPDNLTTILNERVSRYRRQASLLTDAWQKIDEVLNDQRELSGFSEKTASELARLREELGSWIIELAAHRAAQGQANRVFLHDIHPHNVFCERDNCTLVYDYTQAGYWPHEFVVAFCMHRFVREVVIRKHRWIEGEANQSLINACRGLASEFLNAYDQQLPSELRIYGKLAPKAGVWIRDANIDKLINTAQYALELKPDRLKRSPERLLAEVRKFLRYMQESSVFD